MYEYYEDTFQTNSVCKVYTLANNKYSSTHRDDKVLQETGAIAELLRREAHAAALRVSGRRVCCCRRGRHAGRHAHCCRSTESPAGAPEWPEPPGATAPDADAGTPPPAGAPAHAVIRIIWSSCNDRECGYNKVLRVDVLYLREEVSGSQEVC